MTQRPHYPIYIPSKGRADRCQTARLLADDGVPFHLVIEPQEVDAYAAIYGRASLLVMDRSADGRLGNTRNFIKDHSRAAGDPYHWQIDDDMRRFSRVVGLKRVQESPGRILALCEDFVDRYANIALAGIRSTAYITPDLPPFKLNQNVYSCFLVNNALDNRFKPIMREDVDMCLQVLCAGWCTVQFQAFCFHPLAATGKTKGGNTGFYTADDSKLRGVRELQIEWPHMIGLARIRGTPHWTASHLWQRFDTPLQFKQAGA